MIHSRGDIQRLFEQAVKLPPAERGPFLDRCAEGDAALRAIVRALVEAHEESPATIGVPAPASSTSTDRPDPESLGPYRIVKKVGEGGMGTVYAAEQTEPIRRTVALKVIKRGMDTDEVLARFQHERQSLALMNHPGIAQVHDAGATADGRPFFVMEYVHGLPVTDYCDQHQLSLVERIELFLDICTAVQHAHQKGVIHRDLKPSNILVTVREGEVLPKIIDFGLAKSTEVRLTERTVATRLGQIMGTPGYMSPEQMDVAAADIDTRSDVYSLGVILYELLAGVLPFDPERLHAAGYVEVQRIIREVEPPRPSTRFSMGHGMGHGDSETAARARQSDSRTLARRLRGDLDWIVMRCLEKDRARRYASASELAADLERHLHHEPVLAGPPSRTYRLTKFVRKNRGLVAATTLVFTALTAGLGIASYGLVEANHHRGVAELALRDTQTARNAEAERATQLQQVADFQGEQLSGIDVPLMGIRLRRGLLDGVRAASERGRHTDEETTARIAEVEKQIAGANFTDVALASLKDNILTRTAETIDRQFSEQPRVQAQLLQTLADTLHQLGLLAPAVEAQERALDICRRHLGNEHPETLRAIRRLSYLLTRHSRLSEAEPYAREALDGLRRVLGNEHVDTVTSMLGMGALLQDMGKLAEAEPYYREALEIGYREFGDEHFVTSRAASAIGGLLLGRGKLSEAAPYLRAGLDQRRRMFGDDDPDTLSSLSTLGGLLVEQGLLAEAEQCFREALETSRRMLGNEHPDTMTLISAMGAVAMQQGKLDEAERYFREALETSRRLLGDEHSGTLTLMNSMGAFVMEQGKLDEAERYFREALETSRRVLGNEHPSTLNLLNSLSTVSVHQGRFDEGEQYGREALEARRRVLGDDHSDTLISMAGLGEILSRNGKWAEAERCLQQVLETQRRVLGDEHPHTLNSLSNLGKLLSEQHKLAEAEPYVREALNGRRRVLGDEHPSTLRSMSSMGALLIDQGRLAEAEPYSRTALEAIRRVMGNDHPSTFAALHNLAFLLEAQGKLDDAESYLREATEVGRRVLPTEDRDRLQAMYNLAEFLRNRGKLEEAETIGAELLRHERERSSPKIARIGAFLAGHGLTFLAMKRYEDAARELEEAYDMFQRAESTQAPKVITYLVGCYEAWHAAEPTAGHDHKAAEWRAKMQAPDAK